MLAHVLEQLQEQGVTEVMINLHHRAPQMRQWLGNHRQWGLRLHLSYEQEILGTAGGIKRVEALLHDAPFVVMNADVLVDLDLRAVWQWHCQRGALVTMVLRPDPAAAHGPVRVDATDRVLLYQWAAVWYSSEGGTGDGVPGHSGALLVLQWIAPERHLSTTADIYPALLAQQQAVYGYRHTGYWMDVGVPERYRQAHWDMLNGALGSNGSVSCRQVVYTYGMVVPLWQGERCDDHAAGSFGEEMLPLLPGRVLDRMLSWEQDVRSVPTP